MKIDLSEAMKEITERYTDVYNAMLESKGIVDISELDESTKDAFLKEVDDAVFKEDDKEDEDSENCDEAANVVKSFAEKSGKTEAEVEKMWDEAKASAEKEGKAEDYAYITGILKKMLKIDESINQEMIQSLAQKTGKTTEEIESQWLEAEKIADEQGRDAEPDYVVGILKRMLKINEATKKKLMEDAGEAYEDIDWDADYEEDFDCEPVKLVAFNALGMSLQGHLYHLNTVSYAQHMALKEFYEEMEDLSDELIENILSMGYDFTMNGEVMKSYTFQLTNETMEQTIRAFRDIVSTGLDATADSDHLGLNDVMIDMQKAVDGLLYKFTLS